MDKKGLAVFLVFAILYLASITFLFPQNETVDADPFVYNSVPKRVINVKVLGTNGVIPASDSPESFIYDILNDTYIFKYTDNPDFLFYTTSVKGSDAYRKCVRIFFTTEDIFPDFNKCDYGISPMPLNFGERHAKYLPVGKSYKIYGTLLAQKNKAFGKSMASRKFCNVVSAGNSTMKRTETETTFVKLLSDHKKFDFISPFYWIMQIFRGSKNKPGMENYKFTVVLGKAASDRDTTEALSNALAAHTIPIYFGKPKDCLGYNKKAFIDANDYESPSAIVNKVIELDNDNKAYTKMLNEPPLENMSYDPQAELKKFLINIIEKGNKPFIKNPLGYTHW